MTIIQILAFCGMLSPIIYTAMWIVGGRLQPGYSHVRQDVSSLIAVGAPHKNLLDKFIISSSVLMFVFYLGLFWGINGGTGSIIGPVLFIVSGLLGVFVALFFHWMKVENSFQLERNCILALLLCQGYLL